MATHSSVPASEILQMEEAEGAIAHGVTKKSDMTW